MTTVRVTVYISVVFTDNEKRKVPMSTTRRMKRILFSSMTRKILHIINGKNTPDFKRKSLGKVVYLNIRSTGSI